MFTSAIRIFSLQPASWKHIVNKSLYWISFSSEVRDRKSHGWKSRKQRKWKAWQASRDIIVLFPVVKIIVLQPVTILNDTQYLPQEFISLAFLHTSSTKQQSTCKLIFEQVLILIRLKDAKSMDSPVLNCISSSFLKPIW